MTKCQRKKSAEDSVRMWPNKCDRRATIACHPTSQYNMIGTLDEAGHAVSGDLEANISKM
jgi:hypothetical protein